MAGTARYRYGVALGGALLALALASPLSAAALKTSPSPVPTDVVLERAVADTVNDQRRAVGRRALVSSPKLVRAARAHARSMAREGYFSHSLEGSSFVRWIEDFYPSNPQKIGETIFWASGRSTATEVLQVWLRSTAHRATVLARKWRAVGVAAVNVKRAPGVFGGRDVTIVVATWAPRR